MGITNEYVEVHRSTKPVLSEYPIRLMIHGARPNRRMIGAYVRSPIRSACSSSICFDSRRRMREEPPHAHPLGSYGS
jgi:hypothetical protein